jgi:ABC-type branched-subunit amino acid transport system substrate-binding protein
MWKIPLFIRVMTIVLVTGPPVFGQTEKPKLEEKNRYARTPDELVPYARKQPYKREFVKSLEYLGPGRSKPEPANIDTVRIGCIVPLYSLVPPGVSMPDQYYEIGHLTLDGARLAVEEANARGGYRGTLPYKLVIYNDPILEVKDTWLWGPFSNKVVGMIYGDKVWAILTTIGGENSHILIRIALRAEVPVMSAADTDPTFPETKIPWVFRCIGDDRQQCYLLAKYACGKMGYRRIGAIRVNSRYGRVGVKEFREASNRLGYPLLAEVKYKFGDTDFSKQLEVLNNLNLDAVFTWGNAKETALILTQMRKMGMKQPLLCSDRIVTDEFLQVAGPDAEGVVAGYPWDPTRQDAVFLTFKERFTKRFGKDPETYAAHAYDGANMIIQAIEKAGLNRAKIRDALDERKTDTYHGVTGDIPLDHIYQDVGPIAMAVVKNGRFEFISEGKAGIYLPRMVGK